MPEKSPALAALRSRTDTIHQALHHHPLLQSLSQGVLSLDQYYTALEALYGFHRRLADALAPWADLRSLTTPNCDWLEQDLTDLGKTLLPKPIAMPKPVTLDTYPAALGALYVKEGSLLGGRQIARHVTAQLGYAVPCRHFSGLGDATGPHWHQVRSAVSDCTAIVPMCESAQATFQYLADWLDECVQNPADRLSP